MNDKDDLGFGNKSQVRNPVWVLFWVFLIVWCVASLFGCATFGERTESASYGDTFYRYTEPGIYRHMHGKLPVTHHVDVGDRPPGCTHGPRGGCKQTRHDGSHIWYSSTSPDFVVRHELAHAFKMEHTVAHSCPEIMSACSFASKYCAYEARPNCSTVTVAAPGYPLGALLRVSQSGEDILPADTFAEAK